MSQYTVDVPPDGHAEPEIRAFYEQFYQVSDNADAHEAYADMFTKDAKLVMASATANGRDEIIRMRHKMWEKVAKRSHKPQQLYTFGEGSKSVMLYGSVDYELKDGWSTTVEWAARSHFVQDGGRLKMDFYQVYLDSAATSPAK